MIARLAVAVALSFAAVAPAVAGEILEVRRTDAIRFTGPFADRTPVSVRGVADIALPCRCVSVVYGPCRCITVTDPRTVRRETSVHRAGTGADSIVRANTESDDSRVGTLYNRR